MRFAPTGFTGCVGVVDEEGDEDEPEHPDSASSNGASQSALHAVWERPGCDLVNILLISIPNYGDEQTHPGACIQQPENLHHRGN